MSRAHASPNPRLQINKLYRSYGFLWGTTSRLVTLGMDPAEAQWAEPVVALRRVFRQVWMECFRAGLNPTAALLERMKDAPGAPA